MAAMATKEEVVQAVRAMGSDARDLRDAAHEAHHALDAGVKPGCWDRETIHNALVRIGRAEGLASEVMARAVEQLVCADFGVPYGDEERWITIACLELAKGGLGVPSIEWMVNAVRHAKASPESRKAADRVLAVVDYPLPAKRLPARSRV